MRNIEAFLLGILYKADPDPDPDLQKKPRIFRKSGPYNKIHCMS